MQVTKLALGGLRDGSRLDRPVGRVGRLGFGLGLWPGLPRQAVGRLLLGLLVVVLLLILVTECSGAVTQRRPFLRGFRAAQLRLATIPFKDEDSRALHPRRYRRRLRNQPQQRVRTPPDSPRRNECRRRCLTPCTCSRPVCRRCPAPPLAGRAEAGRWCHPSRLTGLDSCSIRDALAGRGWSFAGLRFSICSTCRRLLLRHTNRCSEEEPGGEGCLRVTCGGQLRGS